MKITELADNISRGVKLNNDDLSSIPSNYLYLQTHNIEKGIAISEANAKYISEKSYKKLIKKPLSIGYNDYLIYRTSKSDSYTIFRYVQDLGKNIIPSDNFIIINNPQGFLITFLQHETGRLYFQKELDDITNRANGNFIDIVKQVNLIDIDSRVLDKLNLPGYIPPGNSTISPEELKNINVRSDVITIDNIYKRIKEDEIRLEGYFQRKSNLWADDIKSRLIETIILNMPIPPLFFDVTNDDRWLIVDGLQRVSAIKAFFSDELTLVNLDYLPELQGKKFSDLDRQFRRRFEEKQLSYFAIYPGTPKSVRYKIFKNINVSALVLNRQEIRHAINEDEDSEFTSSRYLQSLTPIINNYLDIPEKGAFGKERMADSELCLRFLAFRALNYQHEYNGSIQDYLDKAMERINGMEENKLDLFKADFEKSLIIINELFPKDIAYTKSMIQKDGPKNFNGNLFGVWVYVISRLSDQERKLLVKEKAKFIKAAQELSNNVIYEKSIDSRYFETIESLKTNIETTEKFIKAFIND